MVTRGFRYHLEVKHMVVRSLHAKASREPLNLGFRAHRGAALAREHTTVRHERDEARGGQCLQRKTRNFRVYLVLWYTGKSNNSLYFPRAHAPTCARAVTPNTAELFSLKTLKHLRWQVL